MNQSNTVKIKIKKCSFFNSNWLKKNLYFIKIEKYLISLKFLSEQPTFEIRVAFGLALFKQRNAGTV